MPPEDSLAYGTVTDGSGRPLEGICIDVWTSWNDNDVQDAAGVIEDIARTAADGTYAFDEESLTTSRISPSLRDFLIRFRDCATGEWASEWYGDSASMPLPAEECCNKLDRSEPGDARVLHDDDAPIRADASLARAASIGGRVTDHDGNAIAGTIVHLYDGTWGSVEGGVDVVPVVAVTDEEGRYRFRGLASRGYRVLFTGAQRPDLLSKPTHVPAWHANRPLELYADEYEAWDHGLRDAPRAWPTSDKVRVEEGSTARLDARLDELGSLSGSISPVPDDCARRVHGLNVRLYEAASGRQVVGFGVPCDGTWGFEGLPPGSYRIFFEGVRVPNATEWYVSEWWEDQPDEASALVVTLRAGQQRTGMDAELGMTQA